MSIRERERAVAVEDRFQGLPGVAHGGYVAGLMAAELGADAVAVRLRRPVPTGRRLSFERRESSGAELRDGEMLLAEIDPAAPAAELPPAVSAPEAEAARQHFLGHHDHPVPGCLVCGSDREPGDGLRIFPGPVAGRKLVAAPWVPQAGIADGEGLVPGELASAALDCAQLWALIAHAPAGTHDLVVTSELQLELGSPVRRGAPHVVVGWPIERQPGAWLAGAAVIGPGGEICAIGRQRAAIASWGVPLGRYQAAAGQEKATTTRGEER